MNVARWPHAHAAVVGLPLFLLAAGCTGGDPTAQLEPIDVVTVWTDAGIVEPGKNKLVPSISPMIRIKCSKTVRSVQVSAIFRRVAEPKPLFEHFGWAIQRYSLVSGATTEPLVLRSQ